MSRRVPVEASIIGANIRRLRKSLGLTQKKMGKILGVSFQQMQKYECGDNRLPVEKLYILKEKSGVSYEYFFKNMPAISSGKVRALELPPPPHSILRDVEVLEDGHLKRKIENIIEILLS